MGLLPTMGSAEIDGAAALDPKADWRIIFPPNPLVGIASICMKTGVGTSLLRWEWILCMGQLPAAGSVKINDTQSP